MNKTANNSIMGSWLSKIIKSLKNSRLFKDSFWAVAGNGLGNFLLLISGILIARFLGKDLYGEYGMVKTTMFYAATFATLYLGSTSTKFIAEYIQTHPGKIHAVIRDSYKITIVTSLTLCVLLFVFARHLAVFIKVPQLATPFRYLGIIIVFRALSTVGAGVLAGFKDFKKLGINNVISGLVMLFSCVPLTKVMGLTGALLSLSVSQLLIAFLNSYGVYREEKNYSWELICADNETLVRMLLNFSYPFAIAELIYTAASFGVNLIVTRYASLGELGMYSACSQWNAIVLFIPGLLGNVILSYLSSSVGDSGGHSKLIKKMLLVNLICTLVPLLIVCACSGWIAAYYGPSFRGMGHILVIMITSTVFTCLARVFHSDLISLGKKWQVAVIRSSYNVLLLVVAFIVLKKTDGVNAALNMSIIFVLISMLSLILFYGEYKISHRKMGGKDGD